MRKYKVNIVENNSKAKPVAWVKGVKYPKGTQFIGQVRQDLGKDFSIHEVDSLKLAHNIGNVGRHINVNLLQGGCSGENYVESNLLAMDFDNGISIKEALEITEEYNIPCTFGYYTFSHNTIKRVKAPSLRGKRKDRIAKKDKEAISLFKSKVSRHWKHGIGKHKVINPRFRLVWELPQTLNNAHLWVIFQNVLIEIFDKKVDLQCDDLARIFFGGKGLIQDSYLAYKDFKTIEPLNLFIALETHYRKNDTSNNTTRELKKFCSNVGLNCINGHLASIPTEKAEDIKQSVDFATIEYLNQTYLLSKKYNLDKKKRIKQENIKLVKEKAKNLDKEKLVSRCQLYKDMIENEWLYHHEIVMLCSNLHNMKGFATDLETNLNSNINYTNVENKKAIYNQASNGSLQVIGCSWKEGCRYFNTCNSRTIIDNYYKVESTVKVLEEIQTISLEEGRNQLLHNMHDLHKLQDNKVVFIKGDAGLGKSYVMINNNNLDNVVIGSPTHLLAQQLNADFLSVEAHKDMKYIKALNMENMNIDLYEEVNQLYMLGMYKEVFKALQEEKNNIEEDFENGIITEYPPVYEDINNYFNATETIKSASKILTTHQRASLGIANKKTDTIIFDEDPIGSLIDFYSVKRNVIRLDLEELKSFCRTGIKLQYAKPRKVGEFKKFLKAIEEFEDLESKYNNEFIEDKKAFWFENPFRNVKFNPTFLKSLRTYLNTYKKAISTNIFKIFKADYIMSRGTIVYTLGNKFESIAQYKKIVVLSATIDEEIHVPLFAKFLPHMDIEWREVQTVKHTGNIYCHNTLTFSRESLKNATKNQKKVLTNKLRFDLEHIKNIISFKDNNVFNAKIFGKEEIAYFGATEGLNKYKGEDLLCIGTPHNNSVLYEALGFLITDKQTIEPNNWTVQRVKKYGFEFDLNTYSNPQDNFLTRIQLYYLYREVIQATGRARTIMYDCDVHYLGALPLPGSILLNLKK